MTYAIAGLALISSPPYTAVPNIWGYVTSTDTIVQVSASGYFNNEPRLGLNDAVRCNCSDGTVWLRIAGLTPTTTVVDTNAVSNLADGNLWVGDASNDAVAVVPSGDLTMDNAGVFSVVSIAGTLLKYAAVAVTAAQFNGMYAAPKLLVAAPGANRLLILDKVILAMTYAAAAYAAGGVAAVQYDSTVNGAGIIASTTLAAAAFQDTASTAYTFNAGVVEYPFATTVNKGLYLSNITGAFTTGDSAMVAHVWYKDIPTT
jgi:hypothetical protein